MPTVARKSRIADDFRAMQEAEIESAQNELDTFVGTLLAGGKIDSHRLRELLRTAAPALIHDEDTRSDDQLLAVFESQLSEAESRGEMITDFEVAKNTNDECGALQARRDEINARWAAELDPVESRLDEIAGLRRKAARADEWLKDHLPRPVKGAMAGLRREIHKLQLLVNETWSPLTDAERPFVRRVDDRYEAETGVDPAAAAEAVAVVRNRLAVRLEQREQAAARIEVLRDKQRCLLELAYCQWPTSDDVAKALEGSMEVEQAAIGSDDCE